MKFFKENYFAILMIFIILIFIAFRFAEPIADGDYFFHLAYGKYFVDNKTIIPDHTIYSWTPAAGGEVYCAWTGEIFFYLLHCLTGFTGIFVFRYMAVLMVMVFILLYIRRTKNFKDFLIYIYIIAFLICSHSGTIHKPELFSFIFINLSVFLYFYIKTYPEEGKKNFYLLYLLPLIILLWVNTHGIFTFGMVFLFLITLGESLNYLFLSSYLKKLPEEYNIKTSAGFSYLFFKHLLISFFLSVVAIFITPYTYHYIFHLLRRAFSQERVLDKSSVMSYGFTLGDYGNRYHLTELFIFVLSALLITFFYVMIKKKRIDFSIILINLVFCYIFIKFIRTTYLWAPVFIYSLLYLQRDFRWFEEKKRFCRAFQILTLAVFLFITGRGIYESLYMPFHHQWAGFGVNYQNPVIETEFLKKYKPGKVLFNDYDTGGYLIWALYPDYKVSIDPRAFPYIKWFPEYLDFMYGKTFDEFIEKYPFDVALIGVRHQVCLRNFLTSPSWRPVFYGPVAVIFVKKDIKLPEEASHFMPDRLDNIKNLDKLVEIFLFLNLKGDVDGASELLEKAGSNFHAPFQADIIKRLYTYRDAMIAWKVENDYEKAIFLFEKCRTEGIVDVNASLGSLYRWKSLVMASQENYREALVYEEAIMKNSPSDITAFYNTGILLYMAEEKEGKKDMAWKFYLKEFLSKAPYNVYYDTAKRLLEGKTAELQLMTYPEQPAYSPFVDGF